MFISIIMSYVFNVKTLGGSFPFHIATKFSNIGNRECGIFILSN